MNRSRVLAATLAACVLPSCNEATHDEMTTLVGGTEPTTSAGPASGASMTSADATGEGGSGGGGNESGEKLDVNVDDGGPVGCQGDTTCNLIDVLFVIDNSGTMGEEQLNLAANFPLLVDKLENLTDSAGNPIQPNINIMVTTTDFGHPLCTPFEKPDYEPRKGAPVYEGCNARINRFTGLDPTDPLMIPEACTQNCPVDIAPADQFLHFDQAGTNVPGDDVAAALSCIGPQGIDGCGYEAQLETMLQAINPDSCWNNPTKDECENDPEWGQFSKPFLRTGAILAIVHVTDEVECSVQSPNGYSYFTDEANNQYWEIDPNLGIPRATSGICWNAGVTCNGPDALGLYSDCQSVDNPALHPVSRYTSYLEYLVEEQHKDVVMLGILGVPPVTEHNPNPPFQPTMGGVEALEYRVWLDAEYPAGDILPLEWADGVTAADKTFEFGGIGPGCTGEDGMGGFTGQAIPNTRVIEVCESLNFTPEGGQEQIRCCIESICDQDFSDAINCLTGIISNAIPPAE